MDQVKKTIDFIGMPINLGCDRKGVELTPHLLRKLQLKELFKHQLINDCGDIEVAELSSFDKYRDHPQIKHLQPILQANLALCRAVSKSLKQKHFPVVVGGDHVLSLGSIAGVSQAVGRENYAVVYVDAHGDFNTPLGSPTGNMHGMHLSYLMGIGDTQLIESWGNHPLLSPQNIYFFGVHALDQEENENAQKYGLNIFSPGYIRLKGLSELLNTILEDIRAKGIMHIHLSFDVDAVDPKFAPGTGVPELDGLEVSEAREIVHGFLASGLVKSMDLVELNSLLDNPSKDTQNILLQIIEEIDLQYSAE